MEQKFKHLKVYEADHKGIKDLARKAGKTIQSFVSDLITAYKQKGKK
jgi:hypothetical protein